MSIQVTLTFATEAELLAYFTRGAQLSTVQHVAQHNAGVSATEKEAAASVGKSTSAATAAAPARTSPTAAAAKVDAPAKTADASAPAAASVETAQPASTAATDAPVATYADLQKAVLVLHAKAPLEVEDVAKAIGLPPTTTAAGKEVYTFKGLKESGTSEQIGAALAAVKAKTAELEVA